MVAEIEIVEELVKAGANVEQIANKQGEFLEKLVVVSESTVAGVIMAKEELKNMDEEVKDGEL
ncbi:hypothetical protein [Wolbachia endosymbiont (group A) of Clivina fossor]|uniref:hypothetical protein n=1 Tax=Wolbachia endosymbiont (group A) of Clivina fossor TaxID=3066133 RepID=UPI0039784F2B